MKARTWFTARGHSLAALHPTATLHNVLAYMGVTGGQQIYWVGAGFASQRFAEAATSGEVLRFGSGRECPNRIAKRRAERAGAAA